MAGLAGERQKKRARVPGLNADRRDSVVGGGLVIDTLVEVLGADEVVVSGEGVREGLARSLARETLRRHGGGPSAARSRPSPRASWAGPRSGPGAGRRWPSALHAALDPGAPGEVAEALRPGRRILDIGRTVDFFDRHEHVADLVLATDLGGFSHRQVALLAAIVRQAGDEDARPRSLRAARDA